MGLKFGLHTYSESLHFMRMGRDFNSEADNYAKLGLQCEALSISLILMAHN